MRDEIITNFQVDVEKDEELNIENVPTLDFLKLTSILEKAINYVRGYFEHLKQVQGIFLVYDVEVGVVEIEEGGHKIMCPEARIRIKGGYRFVPKYLQKFRKKIKSKEMSQTSENVSGENNDSSDVRNEKDYEST